MAVIARDEKIDILKGIAIYLVVLGHINPPQQIVDLIYSFHMPLFMFLSGCTFWYSFQKRIDRDDTWRMPIRYIFTRFRSLIIPYVMWSIIRSIIYEHSLNPITAINNSFSALWFLPTLFGIIVVVSITEYLVLLKTRKMPRGGVWASMGNSDNRLLLRCIDGINVL